MSSLSPSISLKKPPHSKVSLGFGEKNDVIQTPPSFYHALDQIYHFDFDPCPLVRPPWDGLRVDWGKSNYVNPPYSEISKWLEKGVAEFKKGNKSLFLITLRPSCKYWGRWVWPHATDVILLDQNVKFVGFQRAFPMPLCLIEFDPAKTEPFPSTTRQLDESVSVRYLGDHPHVGVEGLLDAPDLSEC